VQSRAQSWLDSDGVRADDQSTDQTDMRLYCSLLTFWVKAVFHGS
jgi:hypothetical protein